MPTPIFIINLEKSTERKAFIQSQFEQLQAHHSTQFPIHFFPAVYGKENPDFYLFAKYNQEKRFQRKGNTMNLSQLGCFASHYLLWEKCIELNQGMIILEDDAIIHNEFAQVYSFISSAENQFEFFWLSPPAPKRRHQKGKTIYTFADKQHAIQLFYQGWGNTTGYYITPKAAQKLLNYTQEWIYEVDITMERYWENKLAFLGLTPFCVEPDFSLESNIPVDKGKNQRTLLIKLKREYYKIKDKINCLIYQLSH